MVFLMVGVYPINKVSRHKNTMQLRSNKVISSTGTKRSASGKVKTAERTSRKSSNHVEPTKSKVSGAGGHYCTDSAFDLYTAEMGQVTPAIQVSLHNGTPISFYLVGEASEKSRKLLTEAWSKLSAEFGPTGCHTCNHRINSLTLRRGDSGAGCFVVTNPTLPQCYHDLSKALAMPLTKINTIQVLRADDDVLTSFWSEYSGKSPSGAPYSHINTWTGDAPRVNAKLASDCEKMVRRYLDQFLRVFHGNTQDPTCDFMASLDLALSLLHDSSKIPDGGKLVPSLRLFRDKVSEFGLNRYQQLSMAEKVGGVVKLILSFPFGKDGEKKEWVVSPMIQTLTNSVFGLLKDAKTEKGFIECANFQLDPAKRQQRTAPATVAQVEKAAKTFGDFRNVLLDGVEDRGLIETLGGVIVGDDSQSVKSSSAGAFGALLSSKKSKKGPKLAGFAGRMQESRSPPIPKSMSELMVLVRAGHFTDLHVSAHSPYIAKMVKAEGLDPDTLLPAFQKTNPAILHSIQWTGGMSKNYPENIGLVGFVPVAAIVPTAHARSYIVACRGVSVRTGLFQTLNETLMEHNCMFAEFFAPHTKRVHGAVLAELNDGKKFPITVPDASKLTKPIVGVSTTLYEDDCADAGKLKNALSFRSGGRIFTISWA